ncbi:hypothetical protein DENSPDRAFT_851032 [Dentipellis sp. KUC8613]|nr:hypothetical protein DENSPDRAFT_851032 [Dentipellis sp. KUC8613]
MARYILSAFVAFALSTCVTARAVAFAPLAGRSIADRYPTGILSRQDNGGSGFQCNTTTEGSSSDCENPTVNTISDFCLLAPATPDSTIADSEGELVPWCTKEGHGTRVIPAGALQGVQFIKTDNYIQIAGFIDQTLVNIQSGDHGGVIAPHGQAPGGTPASNLMYTTGFSKDKTTAVQVHEWNSFIGDGTFCITVCPDDGAAKNAAGYCSVPSGSLGCAAISPNNAQKGVFEACQGEDKDLPGVDSTNGQTPSPTTHSVRTPATSNCQTFSSAALFADAPGLSATAGSTAASTNSGSVAAAGSVDITSGAKSTDMSVFVALVGAAFSAAFLA